MADVKKHPPVKLFFGLLISDMEVMPDALHRLQTDFGKIELKSELRPFTHTDYYNKEMGSNIHRMFMATCDLIDMSELPDIKLYTNRIEMMFAGEETKNRRINIDPGYLLYERFVLASGKNFSHRIYIGSAIYADLTLIYQRGKFEKLPWTYPDYADEPMVAFLSQVRKKYAVDVKGIN